MESEISFRAAIVLAMVAGFVIGEMAAFVRRRSPEHPLGWVWSGMGAIGALLLWYMVDGFGRYGEAGWLRWDHGVILFLAMLAPVAVGSFLRWARSG